MPDVTKTVGRYEVLNEVGSGGMALVYLARQTDLDRYVALKELGAFHASDPSFAQRFLRESRVAGSLSHPNIVTVHDYFEHDGTPYIAMEYVERGSLRPYIARMELAQIAGVLEGLLAGLAAAEQHGIVHRDLKPENLMVTSDGRVKIADFGIAKATTRMQTGAFLTATGTTVGTPTYMAPEQAMAQEVGPWTDLYSVGCMAYELFTGRVPFHDSEAPMAILLRHVNEQIPPPSGSSADRPGHLGLDRRDARQGPQGAHAVRQRRVGRLRGADHRAARPALAARGAAGGDAGRGRHRAVDDDPEAADAGAVRGRAGRRAGGADEFQSFAWGQSGRAPRPGHAAAEPGAARAARPGRRPRRRRCRVATRSRPRRPLRPRASRSPTCRRLRRRPRQLPRSPRPSRSRRPRPRPTSPPSRPSSRRSPRARRSTTRRCRRRRRRRAPHRPARRPLRSAAAPAASGRSGAARPGAGGRLRAARPAAGHARAPGRPARAGARARARGRRHDDAGVGRGAHAPALARRRGRAAAAAADSQAAEGAPARWRPQRAAVRDRRRRPARGDRVRARLLGREEGQGRDGQARHRRDGLQRLARHARPVRLDQVHGHRDRSGRRAHGPGRGRLGRQADRRRQGGRRRGQLPAAAEHGRQRDRRRAEGPPGGRAARASARRPSATRTSRSRASMAG